MYVCDTHGAQVDEDAWRAALKFMRDWKPHIRIHGGDLLDLTPLRRRATPDEREASIVADLEAGLRILAEYRPHVFLRGNHDERLWDRLYDPRGPVRDLAQLTLQKLAEVLARGKTIMLPYGPDSVYELGDVRFVHGGTTGPYAARRHAACYGRCVFGHTHAYSLAVEARWPYNEIAYGVPCLCKRVPDYARSHLNALRCEHGWAYGLYDERTGRTHVFVCRREREEWMHPLEALMGRGGRRA